MLAQQPPGDRVLHVHHSSDADVLVDALADVLSDPLEDVLATEQVAVHSRGLERWVAQRLSHRLGARDGDGACLAVEFPFPGRLVQRALAFAAVPTDVSANGAAPPPGRAGDDPSAHDPWRVERLAWHLLRLLDTRPEVAADTPLGVHLAGPRRFGAVRRVTRLFDRYAVHRPAMLRGWAAGDGPRFADGRALPATHAWQASLWRTLRDDVVAATGVPSPPERLDTAIDRLAADPSIADLPRRVALFGLTALPASYLDVLQALAVHRDVHLFLLHPSPSLWRDTLPTLTGVDRGAPPARGGSLTHDDRDHPLLRSWARDSREMQVLLAASGVALPVDALDADVEVATDASRVAPTGTPALTRIQTDIRRNARPPGRPAPGTLELRPAIDPEDRSLQVHGCHGPSRQVEVLRDLLLHRFAADPSLQPRDVLVLCPDLPGFAPLLEATFGAAAIDGVDDDRLAPHHLRLRLADRALGGANPLLRTTADLLDLVDGRVAASDLRDLLVRPAVRAAFHLGDDDLARIDEWLDAVGARWGLDRDHRAAHGVPTDAGTWRASLDRLLVGVAVADEDLRTVADVVPFDDVTTSDIDLLGRLAELVARLDHHLRALAAPRPIERWRDDVRAALDALTQVGDRDRWQRMQVDRVLDDAVAAATDADGTTAKVPLSLEELRGVVRERLASTGGGGSHRTGDLTVATLVPMRSVPHRLTVLLGMDDGAVPRPHRPDGDDLLELDPRVGDRDPRAEDRQLLLDALLATRDELVVLYTSHHERTNEPVPPALPVSELLDVLDRTLSTDDRTEASSPSEVVTIHHPLHATDPRNFRPGALCITDAPFGSDPLDLAGALACAAGSRGERPPFLAAPLRAPDDQGIVELPDLLRVLRDPVAALLNERFGLRFPRDPQRGSDELPLELGGLDRYGVGERLLTALLDDADPSRALHLERGRGALPPGELATPGVEAIVSDLQVFREVLTEHGLLGRTLAPVPIDLPIAGGRRLVGAVEGLCGTTLRNVGYRSLKEHARLAAWAQLVVLTAADPEVPWRAVTIGRRERGVKDAAVSVAVLDPLGGDPTERRAVAAEQLAWLIEFRDRAMVEPAPFAVASSCRYARSVLARREQRSKASPVVAGAGAWETSQRPGASIPGEGDHGAQRLIHGDVPFARLLDAPARDDEQDPPWDDQEPSRFGRWALRTFEPMLDVEVVEHR